MDKKYLLLISLASILATLLSIGLFISPSSAEHVTCTESDSKTCGSLVDWGYVFGETDFETVQYSTVSSLDFSNPSRDNTYAGSSGQADTLAFGPLYGYRSLYGGIWSIQNRSVLNRSTGLGNYDKDNLWVPSYEKSRIGDDAAISPPPYLSTKYITHRFETTSQIQNNTSSYELESGEISGSIYYPQYTKSNPIGRGTTWFTSARYWNLSVWGNLRELGFSRYPLAATPNSNNNLYDYEVKVNTVTLNGSVPEDTNITVNIYDSSLSSKLGFVKFDSDYATSEPNEISRRIRHKNSLGNIKMGLKRFETINNSVTTTSVNDLGSYIVEVKLNRQSVQNETPKLYNSTNITLSRAQTGFRSTSPTFDGYPRQRLLLKYDTERGERYNLTSRYTLDETLYTGLTSQMSKNLDSYLSSSDRYNTSKFPQIPREELKGNESHRFKGNKSKFYSAEIDAAVQKSENSNEYYHAMDHRNINSTSNLDLTKVFSKVYASINSIEPSILYQQNSSEQRKDYEDIRSKDWERIVDDDSIKMYMSFDGKADKGIRHINNSNFNFFDPRRNVTWSRQTRYLDHEARNDSMAGREKLDRFYDNPADMINSTPNVSYSQATYNNTSTKGTRLSYTLKNITIDYDYGSYYEITDDSLQDSSATNRSIKFGQRTDSVGNTLVAGLIYSRSPETLTDKYFTDEKSTAYRRDAGFSTSNTIDNIAISDERLRYESLPPKVTNKDISKDKSQFNGLFAEVIDVGVSYDIDYHQLEVAVQECPKYSEGGRTNALDSYPTSALPANASNVSHPVVANRGNINPDKYFWAYENYSAWVDNGAPTGNPFNNGSDAGWKNGPIPIIPVGPPNLADGRPACQSPNHKALDGISSWDSTPSHDPRDKYTNINKNSSSYVEYVRYNATDDSVKGGLDKLTNTTEVRLNATLSDGLQNNKGFTPHEMTNERDFSVRTAYLDRGSSKHWFTRDVSGDNPSSSLWTRAEATSATIRDSAFLNQSGSRETVELDVPNYQSGLSSNRYSDAQDPTSTIPVSPPITSDDTDEDNVTIGDLNVTLDLYNYGPSVKLNEEEINISVGNNTSNVDVLENKTLRRVNNDNGTGNIVGGYTHTNTINELDDVDITNEVEEYINNNTSGDQISEIPINIGYQGSDALNSSKFDIDQRFDVVLTFETKTGLIDISSRWDYATFRDTRYDILYNSKSPDSYKDAAIPYLNFSTGERELNKNDYKYPSESMFVRSYLIPTSGSILSENREEIQAVSKPVARKVESDITGQTVDRVEFGGLDSNLCAYDSNISKRYCSLENFKFANDDLEEEIYELREYENASLDDALENSTSLSDNVTYPIASSSNYSSFRAFEEWTLNLSLDALSSWHIAGKASWDTNRISNQSDNQLFDGTRIEVRPIANITQELNESEVKAYRDSPVQHEFDQSTIEKTPNYAVRPASYEKNSINDNYVTQQYVLELQDKDGNPISLRRRFEEIEGRNIVAPTESWGGSLRFRNISLPTSEHMDSNYPDNSFSSDSDRKIQEGICISGETLYPFGEDKSATNSAGTRVDTITQLGYAPPGLSLGDISDYPTANEHCYMTDYNGKLYFTIIAPDSEAAKNSQEYGGKSISNIAYNIEFTGSEDFWWEYPPTSNNADNSENLRLLESSDETFTGTKIEDEQENLRENTVSILGLILLILAILFVIARVLKIRLNPSSGPSTLELVDVFTDPLSTGVSRLIRYVGYLLIILIGGAFVASAFGGGQGVINIIGTVIDLLFDAVGVFVDLITP